MPRLAALLIATCMLTPAGRAVAEVNCEQEPALSEAAAELLLADAAPSDNALLTAVRRASSDAVMVRALFVRGGDGSRVRSFLETARERADAPLACGMAHSASAQLVLVTARGGTLEALAPVGTRAGTVRGRLADGFASPRLVIVDAHGDTQQLPTTAGALQRGIELDETLIAPVRVQLIATGPSGPRPVAERAPVDATALDPLAPRVAPATAPDAPDDLAPIHQLAVIRSEAQVQGLRAHTLLDEVARFHAKRVCDEGRIAHALESGQDPEQRLRARGVSARRVGETIARDRSAGGAFGRMLQSPAHRLTLLERSFTDVGVGQARDARGRVCLVVLLAAWPRYVGR